MSAENHDEESPDGAGTFLPEYLLPAHNLCLLHHDVLVELLRSGEESGAFSRTFEFRDQADRDALEAAPDVFAWLEQTRTAREFAECLRQTVLPAVLSDFLHFVYEALETSRKAKLNVTFALIRKPLQESLFLLEAMAADVEAFSGHMKADPTRLHGPAAGDVSAHEQRITKVLHALGETDRFEARYIAQLRYDRQCDDGFAGWCNKAVHLFTTREPIRTERLNINWVFSGWESKRTQWYFLYSRLPYLMCYARLLVEHVCSSFRLTDPIYLADMERRLSAATVLWWPAVDEAYKNPALGRFVTRTEERLRAQCAAHGFRAAQRKDLIRMADSGAWPGESRIRVAARRARFRLLNMPSVLGELAREAILRQSDKGVGPRP